MTMSMYWGRSSVVLFALVAMSACGGGGQSDESGTETDGSTGMATTSATASTSVGSVSTTATTTTGVGTTVGPAGEPCCTPQTVGGCTEDPAIADCVCETDRYCCEVIWDDVCVEKVVSLGCGVCDPGPITTSPDTGDVTTGVPPENVGPCCSAHPETGCEIPTVAECVCSYDPTCCEDAWRDHCVESVGSYGCGVCPPEGTTTSTETTGGPPDNSEACCTTHASTGCEYPAIADCVCLQYPACCSEAWDQVCADAVDSLGCGVCPP